MPTSHVSSNQKTPIAPGALKLKDAAAYIGGVSPLTVRRLVDRGLLRPNRATRHLLFPIVELDRFLASGAEKGGKN